MPSDDPGVEGAMPLDEDLLVFEDDGLDDVDEETHPPYPEPAASETSPPARFVAAATKLSRSCHPLSSLIVLMEISAEAGKLSQVSSQQRQLYSLHKPHYTLKCILTHAKEVQL